MPLISIILPTYNVEKYIARALKSCINQTLKDIEIIVVDDKGQDKSIDIAKEYAAKDERIQIVDNGENLKLFHARINGALNSNSEFIMFLDPDDELELDACEVMYNNINDSNFDIVICNVCVVNGNDLQIEHDKNENKIMNIDEYKSNILNFNSSVWCRIHRKDLYLKIIKQIDRYNFNGTYYEDYLYIYFEALEYKNKICVISDVLYKYYCNPTSTNYIKDKQKIISYLNDLDVIMYIIQDYGSDHNLKNNFINRLNKAYLHLIRRLLLIDKDKYYINKYFTILNNFKNNKKDFINEKYNLHRIFRKNSIIDFLFYIYYKMLVIFFIK